MTTIACGHCGGRHASMEEVRKCSVKNPRPVDSKPPWERWRGAKRRPRPERNVESCFCGAKGGEPCVSRRTGKVLLLTHRTHARKGIEKRQEEARLNNPDFKPIALDKTYDK